MATVVGMRRFAYPVAVAAVAGTVALYTVGLRANTTTVALTLLLVVLGVATAGGLRAGIFTSAIAVLAFNYFFLPPIGTLTINEPENWVALGAFLVTAITASQLSARAQRRALEATERRLETEHLFELSRGMLLSEELVGEIAKRFGLARVALFDLAAGRVRGDDGVDEGAMRRVTSNSEAEHGEGRVVLPVRLGGEPKGSLWLEGLLPSRPVCEAIANLVAIRWERDWATESAARAEAARRSEKLKGAVLDGLAHDLKTPLTVIKTAVTSLLTQSGKSEERQREFLSLIDEEADRLDWTISEAIQLARVEAADVRLDRRWHEVPVLVREAVGAAGLGDEAGRIIVEVVGEVPQLFCDGDLVKQAVRQLVENAVRYAPGASDVTVRVSGGDGVEVAMVDRGPGVAEEEREWIFEKFYRGGRARQNTAGTGMGLAIAKAIVEAHGGRIRVSNGAAGGAVFTCWFPREDV